MQKLSTGAEFHDFEKMPVYFGKYVQPVTREKDSDDGTRKAGEVIGYDFEDQDGNTTIIGNSHAIAKDLAKVKPGAIVGFKFMGKTTNSKNQPVNRFENILFDSWEEALAYYGDDTVPEGKTGI